MLIEATASLVADQVEMSLVVGLVRTRSHYSKLLSAPLQKTDDFPQTWAKKAGLFVKRLSGCWSIIQVWYLAAEQWM